jgi:tetratricopeptide (TPR) repeat protein
VKLARESRVIGEALLVALVVAAIWLPLPGNGFINFDDPLYITGNDLVRSGLTWRGALEAVTTARASNWHPLTWWSHMLDVNLFGLSPAGHHAMGLALHAATSALLFLGLRRMTGRRAASLLVALIFAIHPLRVESVAWASERKDLLSGLLWWGAIGAYLAYLARPGRGRYWAAVAFHAAGLMAKATGVTLPLILLLLDFWPLGRALRATGRRGEPRGLLLEKVPFLIASAGAGWLTLRAQATGGAMNLGLYHGLSDRTGNALLALWAYFRKTLLPVDLAVFYPFPARVPAWPAAAAATGALLLTAALLAMWRRRPSLAVGWLWCLVSLAPMSGLMQVGLQGMADRYTYVPMVGPVLGVVFALRGSGAWSPWLRRGAKLAAVALVALLAVLTRRQVGVWKDDLTLYRHALAVGADSSLARNNLGLALDADGRPAEAAEEYAAALRLDPASLKTYNNLGVALGKLGRWREAERCLSDAVRLDPGFADAHNNLGIVSERLGDREAAARHYREALRLRPGHPDAAVNLRRLAAAGPVGGG